MSEITIRVIHEWRPGHADPLARITKELKPMVDIVARLTASVDSLALALGNQTSEIGNVAVAIRNHPGSTVDNGKLSALADRLDSITTSITSSVSQLQGLTSEENAEDGAPVVEPPVGGAADPGAPAADPSAAGTGVGDGSTPPSGDVVPPTSASDGTSAGSGTDATAGDSTTTTGDAGSAPADTSGNPPAGDGSAGAAPVVDTSDGSQLPDTTPNG